MVLNLPKFERLSSNHFLDSADLSAFQPHFDSVRMGGRVGQYVFDYASSPLAAPLILFQNNLNLEAGFNIFSILPIHFVLIALVE